MLKQKNPKTSANLKKIFILLDNVKSKGFFHLLSANFIIGFLGFGSQLLVAKLLTPVELGQIKTMQSFMSLATVFAGFGFNTAVLKICSEKRTLEERAFIFKQCLYYSIIPIILVLLSFLFLAKASLFSPDAAINQWLPVFMLGIPAATITTLMMTYLQALKKIQLMATTQVIIRVFGFVVLIALTYFYGLVGFILSSILIGYVALLPLFRLLRDDLKSNAAVANVLPQSFYYAKWSVAANAVSTIGAYMDIFMLNYLIKDREGFGYYSLATIFILGLNYITSTVQSISTPYFSEKMEDKKEFIRVLKKYTKLLVLLSFGVGILAFIIVPPFIAFFFGVNFKPAGVYFRILLLKYFFASCCALSGVAILGLGKMNYNFLNVLVVVPISLSLSYFFITFYGIIGAAVAQAVAYFVTLIIAWLMINHIIKIHFAALAITRQ